MRLSTAASRTEWTLVWLMLAGFLPLGVSRAEQKPPAPEPKSRFFYNDDGFINGSAQVVAEALQTLPEQCGSLGLQLNLGKCKLAVPSGAVATDLHTLFPQDLLLDPETGNSRFVMGGGFELLGAPLGNDDQCA